MASFTVFTSRSSENTVYINAIVKFTCSLLNMPDLWTKPILICTFEITKEGFVSAL